MSDVMPGSAPVRSMPQDLIRWLPVFFGFIAMYAPVYFHAAKNFWSGDSDTHAPVVLAVCGWILWTNRSLLLQSDDRPSPVWGGLFFAFGAIVYVMGVAANVEIFKLGSVVPVLAGLVVGLVGFPVARKLWIVFLFLLFTVPLPGFILEGLTSSLKEGISVAVEQVLYRLGYPIARSGVTLSIGNYQLLVADACSGERSLYSLTALGLLYIYLMKHGNWVRSVLLMASVLPITFLANSLRVMALVLITYHLGDAAGQGFLHEFAGMVLFAVAMGLFFLMDTLLGKFFPAAPRPEKADAAT